MGRIKLSKLTKAEAKEWRSLRAKSKRHKIPIKRIGAANVRFGSSRFYNQLGTGTATTVMDAKIKLKKKKKKRR